TNALGAVTNGTAADLNVSMGTTTLSGLLKNSGSLTVAAGATLNVSDGGVALQGNGASILATGGGSIMSAGNAIAFLGGTNHTAAFDNFNIANQTGDLIFADPS